ncbi:hypothetical protein F53441_14074 [Fusarium austroafricanum]|uniref:2EXR domain-containing protein n=1 Tax=Fusarium austroafricanum TaxID=2364996 RepID=A0A8H4NHX8_9HYPO|nr:hypothetical protein F53441_14074 [Fusarium austroafricanum]
MAPLQIFHLFTKLPYDLRRSIYILATPRRVVRVEEGPVDVKEKHTWFDEGYDSYFDYAFEKFYEQMAANGPNFNVKLHPDLASFAHNWRHHIPWSSYNRPYTQTSLDMYGFTSSRPLYEPWAPSKDVPRIPTDWLVDFPELAFALTRKSCLYSEAEIPVFLHVCVESRQTLMAWGYRLLFSTRTVGPRTWFHPGRDRLYIPYHIDEFPREVESRYHSSNVAEIITPYPVFRPGLLLSGCYWDIGQYSVQDLRQVKSIVLGSPGNYSDMENLIQDLQSILLLLSGLEELLLEGWSLEDFYYWFQKVPGSPSVSERTPASCVACIPVEDIDAIGYAFWERDYWYEGPIQLPYTGYANNYFNRHKTRPLEVTSYHSAHADAIKDRLLGSDLVTAQGRRPPIPITIRHVNLCPDSCSELYKTGRRRLWEALESLDDDQIRKPDFMRKFSQGMDDCQSPFKVEWRSPGYGAEEWPELIERISLMDAEEIMRTPDGMLQGWYLNRFKIPEPQSTEI